MNRLPVISPAKIGLFKISRELQFGVCNHSEARASPKGQGKESTFIQGEKAMGRAIVNTKSKASLGSVLARKGILPVLSSQDMRAPPSGLLTLFN